MSNTRKSKKNSTMVVKSLHRSLDISWMFLNFSELEMVRSYNEKCLRRPKKGDQRQNQIDWISSYSPRGRPFRVGRSLNGDGHKTSDYENACFHNKKVGMVSREKTGRNVQFSPFGCQITSCLFSSKRLLGKRNSSLITSHHPGLFQRPGVDCLELKKIDFSSFLL